MSEALLEVRDLHKSFQTEQAEIRVLQGVDLDLRRGERLAIVGQSGVGKSTLLYILGALDRPTAGTVRFEGRDLFAKSREALSAFRNRSLGFVFQFHHLLPEFDALENVMLPGRIRGLPDGVLADRARAILAEVGLSDRLHHRVGKLSGGERQRVAVARALVLDPPLLLADEPTGNVDDRMAMRLMHLFEELNKLGTTVVIATHNEALVRRLGHPRLRLDGGRLYISARPLRDGAVSGAA